MDGSKAKLTVWATACELYKLGFRAQEFTSKLGELTEVARKTPRNLLERLDASGPPHPGNSIGATPPSPSGGAGSPPASQLFGRGAEAQVDLPQHQPIQAAVQLPYGKLVLGGFLLAAFLGGVLVALLAVMVKWPGSTVSAAGATSDRPPSIESDPTIFYVGKFVDDDTGVVSHVSYIGSIRVKDPIPEGMSDEKALDLHRQRILRMRKIVVAHEQSKREKR